MTNVKAIADNGPLDPFSSSNRRVARHLAETYGFDPRSTTYYAERLATLDLALRPEFLKFWTTQQYNQQFKPSPSPYTLGELVQIGREHPLLAFLSLDSMLANPDHAVPAIQSRMEFRKRNPRVIGWSHDASFWRESSQPALSKKRHWTAGRED